MEKLYFVLLSIILTVSAGAQNAPTVGVNIAEPMLICSQGSCTYLYAEYTSNKTATDYTVSSIVYNPSFPFLWDGIPNHKINAVGDDKWSSTIALPFNFCFYGVNYNQVLIGTNGVITFDQVNQTPLGTCPWAYTATIPNTGFPIKNAIYGVYQDTNIASPPIVDPFVQNVNYYFLDTGINAAPNRILVVNFNELPQYQCNNSIGLQTSQIVLYETTNIIDINVNKRTPCTSWNPTVNGGNGLIGIQNQAGTLAVTPTGRNTGNWSATNEAWRFTPNGIENSQLAWYKNGVLLPSTQNPLTVCMTENDQYSVTITYPYCDGTAATVTDVLETTLLVPMPPFNDPVNISVCTQETPFYIADLTVNNSVILNNINPNDYSLKYYLNLADAQNIGLNFITNPSTYSFSGNSTIYASIVNEYTGCIYVKSFELSVIPTVTPPTGNSQQNFTAGQTLENLIVNGQNIIWYDAPTEGNILPNTTLLQNNTTYYASQTMSGCESKTTNSVRLAVTALLILGNNEFNKNTFSVYPNPTNSVLTISDTENLKSIVVYNTIGQKIMSLNPNQKEVGLDLSMVNSGVYFIKIDTDNKSETVKIIKN